MAFLRVEWIAFTVFLFSFFLLNPGIVFNATLVKAGSKNVQRDFLEESVSYGVSIIRFYGHRGARIKRSRVFPSLLAEVDVKAKIGAFLERKGRPKRRTRNLNVSSSYSCKCGHGCL